ncbi:hypothetical protein BJF81_15605 [Ornithinimicrobium sp. CNJ-824]|nr:crosslink repair DNA glycosylase YcaQ family protein [Ornithinimicrobium sp. CNJ-824]OLT21245.1 hypothetical protein BJF81_15605 [Ornithinimicrobium sp. CNJ-824]
MSGLLHLSREQVLGHRRRVGALDERLEPGRASLRRAAWAGLTDSVPRAALLSIHARVRETSPTTWADESLVQVWGPRFSTYVVPEQDRAVFTLGRHPVDPARRRFAEDLADRLEEVLAGRRLPYRDAGRALGMHPSQLRYAATTGRVLVRWEGAGPPHVWSVPRSGTDPAEARLELARRYLRVLAPGTPEGFETWAGLRRGQGAPVLDALDDLVPVEYPSAGRAWVLAEDEEGVRQPPAEPRPSVCSPAGMPTSCCGGSTGSCWCRTRSAARRCGRHGSGPGRCWWTARSSAPGDAPPTGSPSRRGRGCRPATAGPSRRRPPPCPCRTWTARSR